MDRVELHREYGKDRLRAWRLAGVPYWQETKVTLGRLADGRWYGSHTRIPGGAYAGEEQEVRAMVDDWLTDGRAWVPTPACYDPDHPSRPGDGLRWRSSGQHWVLDE